MESVGRLAGGVAHDFNNMLAVIFISLELARMRLRPDDPAHEQLQEIEKAATRSRDITRQLLAFSRKQMIAPKACNLNDLIADLEKSLTRLIGEDIELRFYPGQDLGLINIDPSQIDQILVNLAVNARDAMPHGGKLTITTANVSFDEDYCREHAGARPGRYVQLSVTDDGVGMSAETRSHLFEPFFTTKEVGKGTGLGLAMIYGIIRQNEGFINVYSELGHGTSFKLYFPRMEEREGAVELPEPMPPERGAGRIMLVEDDEILCRVTRATLETLGYEVTTAHSPAEALDLFEHESRGYALLLTDVVMPGMNGRELAYRLAAKCPGMRVIFMSGYTSDAVVHRGVLEEGVHFIQKPFSVRALASKIQQVLGK
ncbi:MAG: response regulator, partial [Nitrospiraceae bacterium]|nr:response regulator [Nitrospiraceae bacterium]